MAVKNNAPRKRRMTFGVWQNMRKEHLKGTRGAGKLPPDMERQLGIASGAKARPGPKKRVATRFDANRAKTMLMDAIIEEAPEAAEALGKRKAMSQIMGDRETVALRLRKKAMAMPSSRGSHAERLYKDALLGLSKALMENPEAARRIIGRSLERAEFGENLKMADDMLNIVRDDKHMLLTKKKHLLPSPLDREKARREIESLDEQMRFVSEQRGALNARMQKEGPYSPIRVRNAVKNNIMRIYGEHGWSEAAYKSEMYRLRSKKQRSEEEVQTLKYLKEMFRSGIFASLVKK